MDVFEWHGRLKDLKASTGHNMSQWFLAVYPWLSIPVSALCKPGLVTKFVAIWEGFWDAEMKSSGALFRPMRFHSPRSRGPATQRTDKDRGSRQQQQQQEQQQQQQRQRQSAEQEHEERREKVRDSGWHALRQACEGSNREVLWSFQGKIGFQNTSAIHCCCSFSVKSLYLLAAPRHTKWFLVARLFFVWCNLICL